MIVLDSHVWVWWVLGNPKLSPEHLEVLQEAEGEGLGVSIISCWEVAKLVELGRLDLPMAIDLWLAQALRYPGIQLLDLTVEFVVDATRLPGDFHRDPADQLLVATARCLEVPLASADRKILAYEHVQTLSLR